ncbi:peptidase inhibitor family I36 protein [Streptomyces sp. RK9]|uniref:peptidase inhibitor family I36 protein n=1 Tax=Streptomyces sp. RK9 TaxID=3239284 RepID=UPI003866CF64
MKNRLAICGTTAALAFSGLALSAPSAIAAPGSDCQSSAACLYYNSGLHGAIWWTTSSEPNLDGYVFIRDHESAGKGKKVKNNAASIVNHTRKTVRVYFNSGYRGAYDSVTAGHWRDLVNTKNNNASLEVRR